MGELRTATVMFTDVVASTARSSRLGPMRADEHRHEHFELIRGVLRAHRGVEVKTLGDGIMAVFASVADAVDAAVGAQQGVEAANRARPDALELRVGLSVGEVREEAGDYFGAAVVEAARLCADARPRQVLCSSMVRALAASHCNHAFHPVGERTLKGLPEPTAVEEVTWTPLVQRGVYGDFANVDRGNPAKAIANLDLQQQSPLLIEVRERILECLAPRAGDDLLDLGCGTGTDVLKLARLVGSQGRVIGIDKSEALLEEARRRATEAGASNVEFRTGDAERLPLDDDSVDGCRSDRVLQYVPNPQQAVAELVRVTRPGGRVVAADTDWGASSFDCDDLELSARIEAAWTATRANGRVGRSLLALFIRAGLREVTVTPHVSITGVVSADASPEAVHQFHLDLINSHAAQAVEADAVTAQDASRWVALQHAALIEGRSLRFLVMFVAAGHAPGDLRLRR